MLNAESLNPDIAHFADKFKYRIICKDPMGSWNKQ